MKIVLKLFLILTLLPVLASAERLQITENTALSFAIPQGWEWAKEPPAALLEEMAEHIEHEAKGKGYSPTQEQLLDAAKKRLKANEVLLYNPQSTAFMTLDLSHLKKGEKAPGKKTIKLSAKYAGQSLEQEEGVSQLTGNSKEVSINGAWYAYRYDADYLHHEEKMNFSGVIGFASPNWFFFYYTDYLKDPADKQKAEDIFKSIHIEQK